MARVRPLLALPCSLVGAARIANFGWEPTPDGRARSRRFVGPARCSDQSHPAMEAPAALRAALAQSALVAIDLDGTLLSPGNEIPLDNRHALQRARQHVHCIFVTGKNRQSVADLGLENATGVFQNGAVAFLGGAKIFERVVALRSEVNNFES